MMLQTYRHIFDTVIYLPQEIIRHIAGFCTIDDPRTLVEPRRFENVPSLVFGISQVVLWKKDHVLIKILFSNGSVAIITRTLSTRENGGSVSFYDQAGGRYRRGNRSVGDGSVRS